MDGVGDAGGVGAILVEHRRAVGAADFPPADAGHVGGGLDRLVGHQRLVRAEVAVGQAMHGALAVRQDVDLVGRARLRDAVARRGRTGEDRVVGCDRDRVGQDEGRVGRGGEVGRGTSTGSGRLAVRRRAAVVHRAHVVVRRAGRRQRRAVHVGGQQAVADVVGAARRRRPGTRSLGPPGCRRSSGRG